MTPEPFPQNPRDPSSAPAHHAPPANWRPLSGLAVTAFVLSLVLALVALTGYWLAEAIPFLLGAYVLLYVPAEAHRGRPLAGWAAGIAVVFMGLSILMSSALRHRMELVGSRVMSVVSAEGETSERERSLKAWLDPKAIEGGAVERIGRRFAAAVALVGPYVGPVEAGSFLEGGAPILLGPTDVQELGEEPNDSDIPRPGPLWIRARFRDGFLHVVLILNAKSPMESGPLLEAVDGERPSPVIRDIRFFRDGGPRAPPPKPAGSAPR